MESVTPSRFLDILRLGWKDKTEAQVLAIVIQLLPRLVGNLRRLKASPQCGSCRSDILEAASANPALIRQFFQRLAPTTEFDLNPLFKALGVSVREAAKPPPKPRGYSLAGEVREIDDTAAAYAEMITQLRSEEAGFRGLTILPLANHRLRVYFY